MSFRKILRITWNEVKLTFSGFGRFYIEYFRALINVRFHPLAILDWLIMVLFLMIVFLHPYFPAVFKLLSSLFVIFVSYFKTKNFIRNAKHQPQKQHARIRGGILALFPFYLVAVTTFIWGLWEVWSPNDYQVAIQNITNQQENYDKNDPESVLSAGLHEKDLKVIREQKGNPLLNVLNDAYPKKTPNDREFIPDYESALTFWIYSLKVTLRMNFAGITEIAYNLFVDEEKGEQRLYITRLDGWHEFMLVLEVILQLITSILFLGIIADIALAVQHKIQTGEIDIDLSRNYAIDLLRNVKEMNTLPEIDATVESWNKIEQVQKRAIENLLEKLEIEYPISLLEKDNILNIRNSAVNQKVAAILTLGNIKAKSTKNNLIEILDDESLRVRCSAIIALSKIDSGYILENFNELFDAKDVLQKTTLLKVIENILAISAPDSFSDNLLVNLIDSLFEAPEIRTLTINSLRFFNKDLLLEELENEYKKVSDGDKKVALIHALGALNFEESIIRIFNETSEENESLLSAVLSEMTESNVKKVKTRILEIVKNEEYETSIRNNAILALGNADFKLIVELLDFVEVPELLENALITIGKLATKSRSKKDRFPESLFDKIGSIVSETDDRNVREQACIALARTKDVRAYEILISQLPKPEAVIALGILGNIDAVSELMKTAMKTEDAPAYSIEHTAPIEALGNLGESGMQALKELYNKRKKERAAIALVIAKTGLPSAVDFLLDKFNPENLESCKMLAPALALTQDNRVKRPLLNAVKQNPEAAGVITQALLGFEDEAMVEEILKLISFFNDEIRNEVFDMFKFYRPKKNVNVMSSMQKYFGSVGNKAESWAKKLNRILQKHTVIIKKDSDSDNAPNVDVNALDEFD